LIDSLEQTKIQSSQIEKALNDQKILAKLAKIVKNWRNVKD
jgi:hypothetical protein